MPKGYAPSVFVSSTCFDLGQIRIDLGDFIKSLGLEPILSEHATFPVDPNYDAIRNCLETVKTRADIFVLIVGARYGQTPQNGKSVTNLEYLEARAKGIPIYVFVSKAVTTMLPLWKKNPAGDYTGIVDTPALFEFVESLKGNAEHWIFGFENAQDIINILRIQLAYLFMDALNVRSRVRSAAIPTDLQSLPPRALEIALQRPFGWEYLLFAEVFQEGIKGLQYLRYDYEYAVSFAPLITMTDKLELFNWLSTHLEGMIRVVNSLGKLLNETLPIALGAPGVPGDASHIVYVARNATTAYEKAIEWALEFKRLHAEDDFRRLIDIASGMTRNVIREISDYADHVHSQLNSALSQRPPKGETIRLELILTATAPDMTQFYEEMERLQESNN